MSNVASSNGQLEGRLILITGASRGIGRAAALACAAAGAELIITGRTSGALEEVDDEIPIVALYASCVACVRVYAVRCSRDVHSSYLTSVRGVAA